MFSVDDISEINLIMSQIGNIRNTFDSKFYCENTSFTNGFFISVLFSILVYLASKITRNYSWVDRLWPIIPSTHCLNFFLHEYHCNNQIHQRTLLMCLLVWLWGVRLTFNYYRKGGYKCGSEDYRWEYVKKFINSEILFEIFNITFISFIQNVMLFLFTSPLYMSGRSDFNLIDYCIASLFLMFLILETVSDQQQWNFQQEKLQLKANGKTLIDNFKIGFRTTGLFQYSRHPNFFAELGMWWTIYLFSINSLGRLINFSIVGGILYTILFNCSTILTEYISVLKYPEYKNYQKTTSRIIPWFSKKIKSD